MEGTLTIGRFFNIPLKIHWSFILLLAYVLFNVIANDSLVFLGYVGFLFLCVVLHEYGHAIAARKYGVKTKDIILSPIGGVARLETLPEKPIQELIIAFAGPFVNLLLAIAITVALYATNFEWVSIEKPGIYQADMHDYLIVGLYINVLLFGFNLIPAFPMDGGRIFRALLSIRFGRAKATRIAGWAGRIIALAFVIYGLYTQDYLFAFLGLFIFVMAKVEMNEVIVLEKLTRFKVRDFCRYQFTTLHISDTYENAMEIMKRTGESFFLVVDTLGYPAGYLMPPMQADSAIEIELPPASALMNPKLVDVEEDLTLKEAYEIMQKQQCPFLVIQNEDQKVKAVIDKDAISRAINLFS
ncbi:MAG TPA: site-2 protease family protein [Saprospiraceae bacterium]|nr:site-2 protease family protein [Saprospiraceae bacterium]